MAEGRKNDRGGLRETRAFLAPLLWIAGLLASYWVISGWQSLPSLVSATLASIH